MYSLVGAVFCDVHAMRETVKLLTNGSVGFFLFFFISYPKNIWTNVAHGKCIERNSVANGRCRLKLGVAQILPCQQQRNGSFSSRAWKSTVHVNICHSVSVETTLILQMRLNTYCQSHLAKEDENFPRHPREQSHLGTKTSDGAVRDVQMQISSELQSLRAERPPEQK